MEVYGALDSEFRFDLDPCPLNGVGEMVSWVGRRVYCNPPYGRGKNITQFLSKAREADVAVFLLPARTDTKWWHELAMQADEIRFCRGRIKFNGAKSGAPFPSVILVYRKMGEAT
jgi:hypothetical protein